MGSATVQGRRWGDAPQSGLTLLDHARGRLPDADLRVGDIQELPYDDGTLDVAPLTAVTELARVVRPFDTAHNRLRNQVNLTPREREVLARQSAARCP